MTDTITAVLIPTDGPARTVTIDPDNSTETFQSLVGGYIEAIDLPDGNSAFLNEEGKLQGLPVNHAATTALRGHLMPGDVIAGPLVVIGPADSAGRTLSANIKAAEDTFGPIS